MSDSTTTITQRAAEMGREAGKSAASWAFDGNTDTATYQRVVDLYETGDPALHDLVPSPSWLSGEMADDPTPNTLRADLGVPEDEWDSVADEVCTAYEEAANDAYILDVWTTAQNHVSKGEPGV
jgi:hypothetical protein